MELRVDNGKATLCVAALADGILRVRLWPQGQEHEDASWAVPANRRAERAEAAIAGTRLTTSRFVATVDPATLALTVTDPTGRLIHADRAEPFAFDGNGFSLFKLLGERERIHALGDKTGSFDRRSRSFVNWTTDTWGYGNDTDPTYKAIPFYIADRGEAGAHGLFLDNTWRTWFDFGHRREDVIEVGAEGGPIDYYLIAGPTLAEVVRGYAWLTGPAPMPPRWALGFQQCRWSYETAAEVRAVTQRFREERIPLDVIWLDIHFQDRNRPFTVDHQAFPDLAGLVRDLQAKGIRTVAITDLHIAHAPDEDYSPYQSGVSGDHFLRMTDGSTYQGEVWPGPSVFPNFSRAASRTWWGTLYADFCRDGIAGFWNDMNEPAIFSYPSKTMPPEVVHRIEGDDFAPRIASHAELHNVYGMLNTRATAEGLRTIRPDERPFVMTRATFAGGQRYAVTWTGDNCATWEHLRLSIQQLLSLSLSGFTWCGCDIGGFTGGPSADLLTRWIQIGAFMPIMRAHAANGTPRAEPWVDGPEHTALRRTAIEWRYCLLPYLYALAAEAERRGDPVMRPMAYDYPEAAAHDGQDLRGTFLLGHSLLVASAPEGERPYPYEAILPAGGWFDFWTGQRVVPDRIGECGTREFVSETPRIDRLPVFVRAGSIIPLQPLVQSTVDRPNEDVLTLAIYPGGTGSITLHDDDGVSRNSGVENCRRQRISLAQTGAELILRLEEPVGDFRPWWQSFRVVVHGQSQPMEIELDGRTLTAIHDPDRATITLELPGCGGGELRFSPISD